MMKKTSQIQTNLGALQSISLILFSTRKTLGRYMYKLYIVYGGVRGEPASIREWSAIARTYEAERGGKSDARTRSVWRRPFVRYNDERRD